MSAERPANHHDAAADETAAMRAADIAKLEALQAMAEGFAAWLHRKGAQAMEHAGDTDKDGARAAEQVRQLSGSFNKAARAVRQIMVLKHEIAGLRPQPGARPAETLAHRSPNGRAGRFHNGRDRPDIDDYDDAEKRRKEDEIAAAYYEKLLAALDVDIRAAGPEKVEEARKASIAMRLSTIAASIPHPTLDACLAEHGIAQLWTLFGPRYGSSRAPPFG